LGDCRTAEVVSVVSDSEVMVTFVTLYGEKTKTNISERHKIIKSWRRLENKSKGRNKEMGAYIYYNPSEKNINYLFHVLTKRVLRVNTTQYIHT
jgi:hypothetical protein